MGPVWKLLGSRDIYPDVLFNTRCAIVYQFDSSFAKTTGKSCIKCHKFQFDLKDRLNYFLIRWRRVCATSHESLCVWFWAWDTLLCTKLVITNKIQVSKH
jgi:hypothetical protein